MHARDALACVMILPPLTCFPHHTFLHHAPSAPPTQLVDRKMVVRCVCPGGRTLFQITGSQGQTYLVLSHASFCECEAYRFRVLKGEATMCKHVLAARIAVALGLQTERAVHVSRFCFCLPHLR